MTTDERLHELAEMMALQAIEHERLIKELHKGQLELQKGQRELQKTQTHNAQQILELKRAVADLVVSVKSLARLALAHEKRLNRHDARFTKLEKLRKK